MLDDVELLHRYALRQDEEAFSTLVARYVNLVYSVALRQMEGHSHLAEEVAQAVFTDLARKAPVLATSVAHGKPLSGWLHTSTRFAASVLRRGEHRRKVREHTAFAMNPDPTHAPDSADAAWNEVGPLLDDALGQLSAVDRDAVLLRFYQGQDLRSVGVRLGLSEEAARKRVSRALDRLRAVLASRGVSTTVAALSATLVTQGSQVAPTGLAARLTQASLAGATATTVTSGLGLLLLMTTNLKLVMGAAAALLLVGAVVYRANHSGSPATLTGNPRTQHADAGPKPKLNGIPAAARPSGLRTDYSLAAGLARIREALEAPGRFDLYPQPEMKAAILSLREHYREAVPLLREALHSPDWEVRRRAAGGLAYLSITASAAVPDLIAMLREAPSAQDAVQAAAALRSVGVPGTSMADLVAALDVRPDWRDIIDVHFPGFVKEATQRGLEAADSGLFARTVALLTADNEDARLRGLMAISALGPAAIDAIPALKDFVSQPNREDLKLYVEKLLAEIDPTVQLDREDPAFQAAQAERARIFTERAKAGQATVEELVAALRELPQAIPAAAEALGAIGYKEMSRRSHENNDEMKEMMGVTIMLTQIAASNQPLEARLAASEAFRKLQPMQTKPLYTVEEAAPAFAVISNALPHLSMDTRLQIESRLGNMLDSAQRMWTFLQRTGEITDYQGAFLESYARDIKQFDRATYDAFVAAMRRSDPKFLQHP